MRTILLVLFGICLAALVLYLGTKQVTGNLDTLLVPSTSVAGQSGILTH